jgi:hypothetical protein
LPPRKELRIERAVTEEAGVPPPPSAKSASPTPPTSVFVIDVRLMPFVGASFEQFGLLEDLVSPNCSFDPLGNSMYRYGVTTEDQALQ